MNGFEKQGIKSDFRKLELVGMKCFDKYDSMELETKYEYNIIFLYCMSNRVMITAVALKFFQNISQKVYDKTTLRRSL